MGKIWNKEMLRRIKEDEMCLYGNTQKRKLTFTGRVLRGSSLEDALQVLEGKLEATTTQRRPRRMRLDDIKQWTKHDTCEDVKVLAEDRC